MQTFFNRLMQIIDYKEFKNLNDFALNGLGYESSSKLNRLKHDDKNPSVDIILDISNKFQEINIDWLLTGQGEMLKNAAMIITELTNNKMPKGAIPYYNLPVSAGRTLHEITVSEPLPNGYIKGLPTLEGTEAFLPVVGCSMGDIVKEGAIIGVRTMNNFDTLNTERIYLIITRDDRMTKFIEHDENNPDLLWCVSPNFPRFNILKSDILQIYRITYIYNPA